MKGPDGKEIPPTGKTFDVEFCTVALWDNGQIVEEDLFYDLVTFMQQIGLSGQVDRYGGPEVISLRFTGQPQLRRLAMNGYVTNIERDTLDNEDYRRVLFTGPNTQLVLMTLQPGEEIGREIHADHANSSGSRQAPVWRCSMARTTL